MEVRHDTEARINGKINEIMRLAHTAKHAADMCTGETAAMLQYVNLGDTKTVKDPPTDAGELVVRLIDQKGKGQLLTISNDTSIPKNRQRRGKTSLKIAPKVQFDA